MVSKEGSGFYLRKVALYLASSSTHQVPFTGQMPAVDEATWSFALLGLNVLRQGATSKEALNAFFMIFCK